MERTRRARQRVGKKSVRRFGAGRKSGWESSSGRWVSIYWVGEESVGRRVQKGAIGMNGAMRKRGGGRKSGNEGSRDRVRKETFFGWGKGGAVETIFSDVSICCL